MDTQGLVLKVKLLPAHLHDTLGAQAVLTTSQGQLPRLKMIWADQAYRGPLLEWVQAHYGYHLEIVRRTNRKQLHEQAWATARQRQQAGATMSELWQGLSWQGGIEVLPRRWVVERTFAWLGKSRRLSRDYELLPASGEAFIYLAMIRLMLRRLAKSVTAKRAVARAPTRG